MLLEIILPSLNFHEYLRTGKGEWLQQQVNISFQISRRARRQALTDWKKKILFLKLALLRLTLSTHLKKKYWYTSRSRIYVNFLEEF